MIKIEIEPAASVKTFAKITLDRLIKEFTTKLASACTGDDDENIHLLRVAIRRLLTLFKVFPQCSSTQITKPLITLLKRVFRSLSKVRDLSVQADTIQKALSSVADPELKKGLSVLHFRVSQKKDSRLIKVQQSLRKKSQNEFRARIAKVCVKKKSCASHSYILHGAALKIYAVPFLTKAIQKFESFESCLKDQGNKILLHNMRIAAKKYRYILEIFQPVLAPEMDAHLAMVKQIQAELGEIHDCDVWLDFLPRFKDKERLRIEKLFGDTGLFDQIEPGIDWFEKNRHRKRLELFARFLDTWADYKKMQSPAWNIY